MKTDRSIIADLPDKTEVKAFCGLSRTGGALSGAVDALTERLEDDRGHRAARPRARDSHAAEADLQSPRAVARRRRLGRGGSGKFARLREIAETIASRQEKLLVFTQFREIDRRRSPRSSAAFRPRRASSLHGETRGRETQGRWSRRSRRTSDVPFFVLSLKAGGSGLNLTAASHVIHFDRWWNPAVENQATDRAFRIGQKRNVLVHKFVCRGTVEEQIDALIESKRQLPEDARRRRRDQSHRTRRPRDAGPRAARSRRRDEGGLTR